MSVVFRGYWKRPVAWNKLKTFSKFQYFSLHSNEALPSVPAYSKRTGCTVQNMIFSRLTLCRSMNLSIPPELRFVLFFGGGGGRGGYQKGTLAWKWLNIYLLNLIFPHMLNKYLMKKSIFCVVWKGNSVKILLIMASKLRQRRPYTFFRSF